MNTNYNDEDLAEKTERANALGTVSGNFVGIVFSAAVIFISLSSQNLLSYFLSSVLILATFIFILTITLHENVLNNCTLDNFDKCVKLLEFGDMLNGIGFLLLTISMCLLAFYVNLYVGLIITPLIIILSVKVFTIIIPDV